MRTIDIAGIKFTQAAVRNMGEVGITTVGLATDIAALRAGGHTKSSLLACCLQGIEEGTEDDRVAGWLDYVNALVAYVN